MAESGANFVLKGEISTCLSSLSHFAQVCLVRLSVRRSVGPSVRPSVRACVWKRQRNR